MTALTELTDEQLLLRSRNGDEEAFAALFRRWQGVIFRYARHMSGSASIAEDVTQEVFMVLIREEAVFDPARGTLPAFLYGIARHQVWRSLERCRNHVPLSEAVEDCETSAATQPHGNGQSPADELARRETVARVRRAIVSLPLAYREAVVLCDLEEMSYEQAAAALGCAVGTIRSRLSRGRSLLLEKLRRVPAAASGSVAGKRC